MFAKICFYSQTIRFFFLKKGLRISKRFYFFLSLQLNVKNDRNV